MYCNVRRWAVLESLTVALGYQSMPNAHEFHRHFFFLSYLFTSHQFGRTFSGEICPEADTGEAIEELLHELWLNIFLNKFIVVFNI